jgi:hypothetical protein
LGIIAIGVEFFDNRPMMACADAVAPLVAEIKHYILSQPDIHCDENLCTSDHWYK